MNKNKLIWEVVIERLSSWKAAWENEIDNLGQVPKILQRSDGKRFSDNEVYEGFVHAIFTASIDYRIVKTNFVKIKRAFNDFDLSIMSNKQLYKTKEDILNALGFNGRYDTNKTGYSQNNLANKAIRTASDITRIVSSFGSMELFFERYCMNNSIKIAQSLSSGQFKISGMLLPIAHEAIKNVGFDTIKPDRHIKRIFYYFGWYTNNTGWELDNKNSNYKYPLLNDAQVNELIIASKKIKEELGINSLCYLDNVLWLLCSKSGLHYTNSELIEITKNFS